MVLLLVAILVFSAWAKTANFNAVELFKNFGKTTIPTTTTDQQVKGVAATPTPVPIEILVTLTPNGFVPDVIMIAPNTKITWVNKSATLATLASDPQDLHPELNLGDFDQNASVSYTFFNAGRYNYQNSKIPSQKGTIVVK